MYCLHGLPSIDASSLFVETCSFFFSGAPSVRQKEQGQQEQGDEQQQVWNEEGPVFKDT